MCVKKYSSHDYITMCPQDSRKSNEIIAIYCFVSRNTCSQLP